jgi:PST family polysaccharide transporter
MIFYAKFLARPHLFRVLKNSGWLVFDALLRGVTALVIGAWIARYLGPEQFGKLTYVLAYLMFFQVIANLGMDGIVIRDIVNLDAVTNPTLEKYNDGHKQEQKNKIEIGGILGTTFALRFLVGIFCWVLAVGGMWALYGWNSENVILTALAGGCLVFQAANTIDLWFQSQNQSRKTVLAKFCAFLVTNGLRVAFIFGELPLVSFAVAMFIEFLITAVALGYAYKKMPCGSLWVFDIKRTGLKLIKESWPFVISGISITMYMRIDQVMVANMLGEKELGLYSAAIILASMWYVLPTIACTSLLPTFSLSKSINQGLYLERMVKLFRFLLILSVCISIFVYCFSGELIHFFYGDQFKESAVLLKILIFTTIPVFMGVGQGIWSINEKKSKHYLMQTISGGIVCVILNIILVPRYGLEGAAISLLIAQFTAAFILNAIIEKDLFKMQFGMYKNHS